MSQTPSVSFLRIQPTRGFAPLDLKSLWEFRELLYFLVWRDVKVRYKQTALGVAWAVIQPVFTMVVFSVFFGWLGKIPSDGMPYPLFAYCALLPWQLFAYSLIESSNSLVANQNLITKVFFPRLVIPLASTIAGLVDFFIASFVLAGMMVYYQVAPTEGIWMLPLLVMLAVFTALGVGLWMSALNVEYRDVRYLVPFLTQLWMFVTPIAYPSSLLPEAWRFLYGLNPMVGVVEGFRWALLGTKQGSGGMFILSVVVSFLMLGTGLYHFRRVERRFADVV